MANRLRDVFSFPDLCKSMVHTIVGSMSLALVFFISSDFIFKTPDLTGRWEFTTSPEFAKKRSYELMQLTYTVLLYQEGERIKGVGEKIRAYIPPNDRSITPIDERYPPGPKRVRIQIEGYIDKNYLAKDKVVIQYHEAGALRESTTVQVMTIENASTLTGEFKSTISDSEGKIKWRRVGETTIN